MSVRLGWISTPLGEDAFLDAVKQAALLAPGADEVFEYATESKGTACYLRNDYVRASEWGQAISLVSKSWSIAFLLFEGVWSFDVFDRGTHVLFFDAHDPYLGPLLGGNVTEAARLLGTEDKIIKRYFRLIEKAFENGEAEERAFSGDEYPAAGEWGCLAFAAKCKIPILPEQGKKLAAHAAGNTDWTGLPQRLSHEVCAPDSIPKRLKFDSRDDQNDCLVWASHWYKSAPQLAMEVLNKLEKSSYADRGYEVQARELRIRCLYRLGNKETAIDGATTLVKDWLQAPRALSVNQYLAKRDIETLARELDGHGNHELLRLFQQAELTPEPEVAVTEGDYF